MEHNVSLFRVRDTNSQQFHILSCVKRQKDLGIEATCLIAMSAPVPRSTGWFRGYFQCRFSQWLAAGVHGRCGPGVSYAGIHGNREEMWNSSKRRAGGCGSAENRWLQEKERHFQGTLFKLPCEWPSPSLTQLTTIKWRHGRVGIGAKSNEGSALMTCWQARHVPRRWRLRIDYDVNMPWWEHISKVFFFFSWEAITGV